MDKHDTLLLACGATRDRQLLRSILHDNYNLLEATSSQQLQILLNQNRNCIAALVSDMGIWEETNYADQIPVILISENDTPELLNRGYFLGAADVIPLNYDSNAMLHRIETIVQLYLHRQHLQAMVEEKAKTLRHANEMMVDALSSIIEYRSAESGQHILRIRRFTKILLEEVRRCCPEYQLTDEIVSVISSAAALHDVGKIAIPDAILTKPGKLTEEEWETMKTHADMGCHILDSVAAVADREYLRYAYNICRYHHERWDGSGYPAGLSGEDIPLCAQVVGLADAYDALTSKRVYKDAYSFETAMNMILNGECGLFSPKLLECFKHVSTQYEELAKAYADGLMPKTEQFDVTLPGPVAQDGMDSLNTVQGKYLSLLHYINGFVLELSVDKGHYHLRYNPYPELAPVADARNFEELRQIVLEQIVHPADRERMETLLDSGIENYLQAGLRRQSFRFLLRDRAGEPEAYNITLLRANINQQTNRSLAVLCCKETDGHEGAVAVPERYLNKNLTDGTFCCLNDRNMTLAQLGTGTVELAGYHQEEILSCFDGELIRLVHPDDRDALIRTMEEQFSLSSFATAQYRVLAKDGTIRWVLSKNRLEAGSDGKEYIHALVLDNTDAHKAYEAIDQKIARYEIILAQTENVLFDWDVETDTISFSDTWEKIFGMEPISEKCMDYLSHGALFHPDDMEILTDHIERMKNGSDYEMAEIRMATARGRYLWCRFRATAIRDEDGKLKKICGIIINVDAEKQSSQELQERAEQDALTKLLNKYAGRKQAEAYFARHAQDANCAMLMIDLDNFKLVNDRYGHLFGDTVLTQVSRVLKKMFRSQDIIARVGGDEFMVLMGGISDRTLLENRCQQLSEVFANTFRNLNQDVPLSCSIGVAIAPAHGHSYYELFQHADQAMYQAKSLGKNTFAIYDESKVLAYEQHRHMSAIDSDREPGLAENSLVQYAFQRLYSAQDEEKSIHEILDLVGKKMNVSRVYVFENSEDNRFCSNTYEWCNEGIQPEIGNLQDISYEDDIAGYMDMYDENGIFYCPDINTLPQNIFDIVAPQGIKSLLHCAIRDKGVFRGYIGFDECATQRIWTKEQIEALTYLSGMLSVFLLKKREQEKALRQAEQLSSILDNQNAWIYIIDPDTCELKYLNAKTRELAPDVKPGMRCYKALMGLEERCPGCPSANIRKTKTDSAQLYSSVYDLHIFSEATLVRWDGTESCLLTCREMKNCTEK